MSVPVSPLLAFAQSSGGGSLISSGLNAVTSAISSKKQYDRQKKLMEMQQEYQTSEREASQAWQRDMWNLGNAYNSPVQMMERLRSAGLSPDLMYGQNGVSSMMAGPVPGSTNGSAPSVPTPAGEASSMQYSAALGDAALRAAQVANVVEDTNYKGSQQRLNESIILLNGSEISLNHLKGEYTREDIKRLSETVRLIQNEVLKVDALVKNINSGTRLNEQQLKEWQESFSDRMYSYFISNKEALSRVGINEKVFEHYTEEIRSRIAYQKAQTRLTHTQQSLDMIDLQSSQLEYRAARDFERDLGKTQGYVYRRLLEITDAMMTGNEAMLNQQVHLFTTYSEAQQIIDMITQVVGSIISGASNVSQIKQVDANTDATKYETFLKKRQAR